MGKRIIAYDIHTPNKNEPEEERDHERQKRARMDIFFSENKGAPVSDSVFTFDSNESAEELYNHVWETVFNPERDGDSLFVGELCNDTAFSASKRYWKRAAEIAQIKK